MVNSESDQDEPKLVFFADEDVDGTAIKIAREGGVYLITMHDVGLRTSRDDRIPFDYAAERGYVLITGNPRDYETLFGEYIAAGQDHPGLIFIRPGVRELYAFIGQELITYYLSASSVDDFKNRIFDIQ